MLKRTEMRWSGQVTFTGQMRNAVRKPEGKRPLGRSRRRWENNTAMNIRKHSGCSLDQSDSEQGPKAGLVGTAMKGGAFLNS
jgi:hypothetical protein